MIIVLKSLTCSHRARLSALYSDFTPLATLNPDGYAANVSAWTNALSHALVSPSSSTPSTFALSLNNTLLRDLNTEQWGMPLALGTVVKEALSKREWIEYNEFINSKESVIKSKGWGVRIPSAGEVLGWGARTISGFIFTPSVESFVKERRIVVLENLEVAVGQVERRMEGVKSRSERVLSKQEFRHEFETCAGTEKTLNDEDVSILLKYLERDKKLLVTDGTTIRFRTPGEKDTVGVITEQDTTIANLKSLIKDLRTQISSLENKVEELTAAAKLAVSKNHRTTALATLKSKKLTESTLSKRHATLTQLEEVFNSIEQASDQVDLVKIMEDSGRVLAGLNKEIGGVERVDGIVDALREQMSAVTEVGDVINEIGTNGPVDEAEVEDEFEEMERVEREKREAVERKLREEKEKREAEETKRRLDELEAVDMKAKDATQKDNVLDALNKSTEGLKRMSLEPNEDGTVAQ